MRSKIFCLFLVCLGMNAFAQTNLSRLDVQRFSGSSTWWLTPKAGESIDEAEFFSEPGVADVLEAVDEMVLVKEGGSEGEQVHRHYQQVHGGVVVEGAVMITHAEDGLLRSANGVLAYLPTVEEPAVTAGNAALLLQTKLGLLGPVQVEGSDYELTGPRLVYTPISWEAVDGQLDYRLAYRIEVLVLQPYSSSLAYVDAHTGEVFRMQPAMMNCSGGSALTLYNGWQAITTKYYNFLGTHYELRDECRGERIHTRIDDHDNASYDKFFKHSQCADLKDGDNLWQDDLDDRASASVHWGAEMFYDYLEARLGRDGIDGNDGKVKLVYHPKLLRVRYYYTNGDVYSEDTINATNAYWDRFIDEAHFGRGDGISPIVSLDVVSHELTHAFISYEDEDLLTNAGEARALNESFGDIFGTCSEWHTLPLVDPGRAPDFTVGEDVFMGPFRRISDPESMNMPRTFEGPNWDFNTNPDGHVNGAVQSYWFYLLAYGSWGRPTLFDIGVCGIGMDAAAQIAYHNITDFLGTASTFADARQGSILAAEALYGQGSNEALQCANAWAAVNVGPAANVCAPVGEADGNGLRDVQVKTFPNPTQGAFTLVVESPIRLTDCSATLWNTQGVAVSELPLPESIGAGGNAVEIDCSRLPAGSYVLLFSTKSHQIYKRIVIVH